MKDTITLHCNFCKTESEIMEDHVRALVYEEEINLEIECPNCNRIFADVEVPNAMIVLKDPSKVPAPVPPYSGLNLVQG